MANLTIKELQTGEETPVQEVDLGMTNKALIEQLIEGRVLNPLSEGDKSEGQDYSFVKGGRIIDGVRTLNEIGYQDGDVIEITKKAVGAKF